MTFTDIMEHSSKLFHNYSMNNNLNKKDQHRKLKRLNTSILNLIPRHRKTKNFERKNTNDQTQQTKNFERKIINDQTQQTNSFLHPPSIITTSDLSRSISNKSITFASVFDELENENNNRTTCDFGESVENEDLVIVVPNKCVNNEPILNNSNTEPYPFRSEIFPKFHSSTNMINSSGSKKKLLHHLFRSHRPRKLCHSVKTIQSVNTIDRSKSAPNLLCSLSSIPPISTTNDGHHPSLKTFRQWFKSLSFGRFIQSFTKHPNANTNTKHLKQKSRVKPTTTRKYSDLIY